MPLSTDFYNMILKKKKIYDINQSMVNWDFVDAISI